MLTVVILSHNSQKSIKQALDSVAFADEIIVIDDASTDITRDIAIKAGAIVHIRNLCNDFSGQRNFGLQIAENNWVLFLDADERISPKLGQQIRKVIKHPRDKVGFTIPRLDHFLGVNLHHGETGHLHLLRLAQKDAGKWRRPVHETWEVAGPIGELDKPILHHGHQNLEGFMEKINFYTDLEANFRGTRQSSWTLTQTLIYPPAKFIHNYFFKLGFLDGFPGFIMAFFMSLHSLVLRVKLYEKTH